MSVIKLDTGFNIELILPVAAFHKRLFAWMIDLFIQLGWLYFIDRLFTVLTGVNWDSRYQWVGVLLFLPVFLYHLIFELTQNGQSPGKKIAGIRVITLDGGQPTASQYLLRWAFKVIDLPFWILVAIIMGGWYPWTVIFLFSGLACLLLSRHSQRIGDLLAGTVLADIRVDTTWQDTIFVELEKDYQPVFPQVMQLSDSDINSIRQIIRTTTFRSNDAYITRIVNKVQQALKIESDLHGIDFLDQLLKDYNHLSAK